MTELRKDSVNRLIVAEDGAGQRLDNYLVKQLKGVPKSRIYRLIRGGEVRVNSRRAAPDQRLDLGDQVRVPPVRMAEREPDSEPRVARGPSLKATILYEDENLLAINKPSGLAVHGGSGISRGVIEQLRAEREPGRFLELVHRLDRETSGVLLLAKKRAALVKMHAMLRDGKTDKRYLMLVKGRWRDEKRTVKLPLHKFVTASGERRVMVKEGGQASETVFYLKERLDGFSLLEAHLKTGRTHQLRVQLAHLGHPIAGDDKYGDFELNKSLQKSGLKRMFLHAASLGFIHPSTGDWVELEAPLPEDLTGFMCGLRTAGQGETS